MGPVGQLRIDAASGQLSLDGSDLREGDALRVLVVDGASGQPVWIDTSVAADVCGVWYLSGLVGYQVSGLFACKI